jgi:hypothetical protein
MAAITQIRKDMSPPFQINHLIVFFRELLVKWLLD